MDWISAIFRRAMQDSQHTLQLFRERVYRKCIALICVVFEEIQI